MKTPQTRTSVSKNNDYYREIIKPYKEQAESWYLHSYLPFTLIDKIQTSNQGLNMYTIYDTLPT